MCINGEDKTDGFNRGEFDNCWLWLNLGELTEVGLWAIAAKFVRWDLLTVAPLFKFWIILFELFGDDILMTFLYYYF